MLVQERASFRVHHAGESEQQSVLHPHAVGGNPLVDLLDSEATRHAAIHYDDIECAFAEMILGIVDAH